MLTIFNIVLIALVGLIAYWWANQGLFSAILHLVCVVVAGAVALAFWEPVTVGFLLRGSGFDNYAWGVSLIGMFVVVLLILRVIMDKVIPANVKVPQWANFAFGLPVGAMAGILTMGILMIGAGFIQSTRSIMGFVGHGRVASKASKIEQTDALWLPVHSLTADFYELVSATSLYPTFNDTPLRAYYPNLDAQAASLIRDSYANGRGKLSLKPSDATIQRFLHSPDTGRYAVSVLFNSGARDFGEQLTVSSAQIQLIGRDPRDRNAKARVAHPDEWTQYSGHHRFDDASHFVSSEPGQSTAQAILEFKTADLGGQEPAFIMIRGTRYRLPAVEPVNQPEWIQARGGAAVSSGGNIQLLEGAPSIQEQVTQSFEIRPVTASINQKPSGIELVDRFISAGLGEFATSGGGRPSPKLEIRGVWEPAGTRIVQVDVSRGKPASIYDSGGKETDKVLLVDGNGRGYQAIGYIHTKPDNKTIVMVDFQNYVPLLRDIPALPTSNTHIMKLLFAVTDGATVRGLVVGESTIGTCSLPVRDPKAKAADAETAGGGMNIGG